MLIVYLFFFQNIKQGTGSELNLNKTLLAVGEPYLATSNYLVTSIKCSHFQKMLKVMRPYKQTSWHVLKRLKTWSISSKMYHVPSEGRCS